jgi:hypothetical protein
MNQRIIVEHTKFRTVAMTSSMALLHWHEAIIGRMNVPAGVPQGLVLIKDKAVKAKSEGQFLDLVIGACERTFGKAPKKEQKPLLTFPPFFKNTEDFESACWRMLEWIREHGDITLLAIEYYPEYEPS